MTNTEVRETEDHIEETHNLIYGLNDCPPFVEAILVALQHVMAVFVSIITPPLLISSALELLLLNLNRSQSDACILQLGSQKKMASLFPPLLDAV